MGNKTEKEANKIESQAAGRAENRMESQLPSRTDWNVEQYIPVADMLGKTFGSGLEVVLHDLLRPQNSVVYTVNGHVTGRKVGQSFDHLVRQVLLNENFSNDYLANYYFYAEDGRLIKSSTVLLRNPGGQVAGAMCLNMDTTVLNGALQMLSGLLPGIETARGTLQVPKNPVEEPSGIVEIADQLIDRIIGSRDAAAMKREDKVAMIRFMDQKGLFLIKGTVDKVAARLGISKVTVYSYLDEVKGSTGEKPEEG